MKTKFAAIALAGAVACAAGVFAGLWGWDQYKQWRQAAAELKAKQAAEAERQTPEGQGRAAVAEQLHDPSSAQWKDLKQSRRVPGTWCGQVNAKNRMGGYVGFTRFIVSVEADRELRVLDRVRLEDKDQASGFPGAWKLMCEE